MHADVLCTGALPSIAVRQPPVKTRVSALELLFKLDSWTRPGVAAAELASIITRCECGLVTTKRAFGRHECAAADDDAMEIDTDDEAGQNGGGSTNIVVVDD